jgi:hypothetical protein
MFGSVLKSFRLYLSLSIPRALLAVRWMILGSVLGEIALRSLCLVMTSSHMGWWGGRSSLPHTPAYGSQPPTEGTGPTYKTLSGLVAVMVDGICPRKGSFPGHRYLIEGLSFLVPAYGILHIVNGFLRGDAYPLAALWFYLGMFPRHSNVGHRWDGVHTRVCSVRCTWVSTTTSHHGRCLRSTPPEAQNGRCLSITGSPRACGGLGPLPRSRGKADGWGKSQPLMLNRKVE